MIRIGITGIFGSGKSTVSQILKKMGVSIISCDSIVRRLLTTKKVKEEIADKFGHYFLDKDGHIDRKKLATLIFSSKKGREKINRIIHPKVFEKLEKTLDTFRKKGKIAVAIEIPLLFETRSEKLFDVIITVYSPVSMIKERLKKKYSPEEINMRLKSQMSINRKIRLSDYVIDNSGSIFETRTQVKKILEEIMRRHSKWQKKSRN